MSTRISKTLKLKINRKVKHCIRLAEDYYDVHLLIPKIIFKNMGPIAGLFDFNDYGDPVIYLNTTLLLENKKDFLDVTIPHEVAHQVAMIVSPNGAPHGKRWKEVMQVFGVDSSEFHTYDITNAYKNIKKRQTLYCAACGKKFVFGVMIAGQFVIDGSRDVMLVTDKKKGDKFVHLPCDKGGAFKGELIKRVKHL